MNEHTTPRYFQETVLSEPGRLHVSFFEPDQQIYVESDNLHFAISPLGEDRFAVSSISVLTSKTPRLHGQHAARQAEERLEYNGRTLAIIPWSEGELNMPLAIIDRGQSHARVGVTHRHPDNSISNASFYVLKASELVITAVGSNEVRVYNEDPTAAEELKALTSGSLVPHQKFAFFEPWRQAA